MKCANCSNGAEFGNRHCIKCLDEAKERSAKRYNRMKTERKCKTCGGLVEETKGVYCKSCNLDKQSCWADKKAKGLCVTCGKEKASNGLKCIDCYNRYVGHVTLKREQRLEKGCCAFCDDLRVSNRLCLNHFLKFTSKSHFKTSKRYKELIDIFNRQDGICPYSGRALTLGLD